MIIKLVADDFGATVGVNNSIIILHKKGIINHAALMYCGKALDDALKKIKDHPDLKIGLHFVLSEEKSLTNGITITKNGYFYPREKLLKKSFLKKISYKDVKNELIAQYNYLTQKNIKISFLNGHRHVHIFPIIRDVVLKFAQERNLEVRIPDEPIVLSPNIKFLTKKIILKFLSKSFKKLTQKYHIKTNDYFTSNWCINNPDFSFDETLKILKKYTHNQKYKGKILEYMIHPGIYNTELDHIWLNDSNQAKKREVEFNTLNSHQFINFIESKFEKII